MLKWAFQENTKIRKYAFAHVPMKRINYLGYSTIFIEFENGSAS